MAVVRKKKVSQPHRRQPSQQRAHVTVAVILEAASQVLRSAGRVGFNTNRIAERAGVSIGTLYGYFPNKDAIFIALARRVIEEDAQALTKVIDEKHGLETLRRVVRVLFRRHCDDWRLRRIVMSTYIASGFSAEHDQQIDALIAAVIGRIEPSLERSGPPLGPIRLFAVSRAILGIARGLTEQGGRKQMSLSELEDEAIRLVRNSLA